MMERQLGQGLTVSALGLGCMGMSQSYGPLDNTESTATIYRAMDLGVTFFDTADVYGDGANEELLGRAINGRRDEVIIATKFGNVRPRPGGAPRQVVGAPEYVKQACEASLTRLGVEYIDLYYQHRVDRSVPIEDTWGAMHELVEAGKIRYLGISEASPATVRRAHAVHPMAAVQNEYSLFVRDVEDELLEILRELGIGLVAYSPLGRGILSGTLSPSSHFGKGDNRPINFPWFQGEHFGHNLKLVDKLKELAAEKGVTPSQLALAWLLSRGDDVVPITGTKRRKYLEENLNTLDTELSTYDLAEIDRLIPRDAVSGDRMAPWGMARMNG
jgi:aryl-alcohol dehydrogenase-like predicted oxidoreductase